MTKKNNYLLKANIYIPIIVEHIILYNIKYKWKVNEWKNTEHTQVMHKLLNNV